MVDVSTRDKLESWLMTQPRELLAAISYRSAVKFFPIIAAASEQDQWPRSKVSNDLRLPMFRSIITMQHYLVSLDFSYIEKSGNYLFNKPYFPDQVISDVIESIASASSVLLHSDSVFFCLESVACAESYAKTINLSIVNELKLDVAFLARSEIFSKQDKSYTRISDFVYRPLWLEQVPKT